MIFKDGVLVSPGKPGKRESQVQGMRVWPPERSKLSALSYCGGDFDLTSDMRVLYLGAAVGTTVSFVADYVEVVYAVEFAPDPLEELLLLAARRVNIIPLPGDARKPDEYALFLEPVDLICQDIAQRDQPEILVKNLRFLKPEGWIILFLKMKSISAIMEPREIVAESCKILTAGGIEIRQKINLNPYYPQHVCLIGYNLKK